MTKELVRREALEKLKGLQPRINGLRQQLGLALLEEERLKALSEDRDPNYKVLQKTNEIGRR